MCTRWRKRVEERIPYPDSSVTFRVQLSYFHSVVMIRIRDPEKTYPGSGSGSNGQKAHRIPYPNLKTDPDSNKMLYLRIRNTVCAGTWSAPLILMVSEAYWKSALMTRELTAVGRWHHPNIWLRIFRQRLAQQISIIQSWHNIGGETLSFTCSGYDIGAYAKNFSQRAQSTLLCNASHKRDNLRPTWQEDTV
jgi:hypothetical protein